jgi:transposase
MFKEYDRKQDYLLPPSLQDFIPADDPVHVIAEAVELLDLSSLYSQYSSLGQNAYHPKMLLAVLFYAYSQGVFSSRQIARQLKYDVRYMYLAGMQTPDFRTIADFRKNHRELFKTYFQQLIQLCRKAGLLPLRAVAIDGSKIQAAASDRRFVSRAELAQRLDLTEAEIEQLVQAAEAADVSEDKTANPDLLSPQLQDLRDIQQRLLEAQAHLTADKKQQQVNLTDPDCRAQKGVGAGYNAQLAVDCDSQLIVGSDVVSDTNDRKQLIPMITEVETATDSEGQAKEIMADAGFASAAALAQLENQPHLDAYVPTQAQKQRQKHLSSKHTSAFDKSHFDYDIQQRACTCPQGQPMRVLRQGVNKSGQPYINFVGTACPDCPVQRQCTKVKYRNLVVLLADPLLAKMKVKMNTAKGKQAMQLRRQTVEPVFGILKEQLGFRRFHLRGLDQVKGEFALLCTAFNLKKLSNILKGRNLAQVLALLKPEFKELFFVGEKICVFLSDLISKPTFARLILPVKV